MASSAPTIRIDADVVPSQAAVLVLLPQEVGAQIPPDAVVEGTMGGFPFRAAVESGGLRLGADLQRAVGAHAGKPIAVEITRIGDQPEVMVPEDLTEALSASPAAKAVWEDITPMARREWVRWIASAKQEETRARRIAVGIDKMLNGMRRPCCFPGLNFVTKGLVPPEDTWGALPGGKTQERG